MGSDREQDKAGADFEGSPEASQCAGETPGIDAGSEQEPGQREDTCGSSGGGFRIDSTQERSNVIRRTVQSNCRSNKP